jgi:hypothetical protein
LLVAALGTSLRAADIETDNRGERIREGIIRYLGEIREKKGELNGPEGTVKNILATDARLKDLKAAKIERTETGYTIDIWVVDAKLETFTITLTNAARTEVLMFEGSAVGAGGAYRVKVERVLRARGK